MEILEAFDLTGTLRGAAELVGCDHKTVGALGARPRGGRRRVAGGGAAAAAGGCVRGEDRGVGGSLARARIRADVAHQRLVAMGYLGSERTTRRAVAAGEAALAGRARAAHAAVDRPSPGCGCSGTTATGPRSPAGRRCCSARGWRGRASASIVPLWDRTMPSVVMALDRALRRVRRRADLRADRQREDGVGRSRLRGSRSATRGSCRSAATTG